MMRTVDVDCSDKCVQQMAEGLSSARTKFLAAGHVGSLSSVSAVVSKERIIEKVTKAQNGSSFWEKLTSKLKNKNRRGSNGDLNFLPQKDCSTEHYTPPKGHTGPFVAKAVSKELLEMSISLFRKKFSPDMHYIFPLIAYQQELHNLDFRECQTWVVYDGCNPAGAVAFRFRDPILQLGGDNEAQGCLEVLFISVWEHFRNKELASELVKALEMEAHKRESCKYMYVEIGHEQPLAKRFWGKNQFAMVNGTAETRVPLNQIEFFEHMCLRFNDTVQFIKPL